MQLMTTTEAADYLRIGERKVYQLVNADALPHLRVGGKLLFPRERIDRWLAERAAGPGGAAIELPPVFAGSEDTLLDWAIRESECGLAVLYVGSMRGAERLLAGSAMVAGLHLLEPEHGAYNLPARCGLDALPDLVMIEWARRRQGLLLAPGNPLAIAGLADLPATGARLMRRQAGAGAERLLDYLLAAEAIDADAVAGPAEPARSETELAAAVATGRADCGLGIEAVARSHGLDFLALHTERFDLALRRRDYFGPTLQALWAFTRTPAFARMADTVGGYEVDACGRVVYNA